MSIRSFSAVTFAILIVFSASVPALGGKPLPVRHGEWVTITGAVHNVRYSVTDGREILWFTLANNIHQVDCYAEEWEPSSLRQIEQGLRTASRSAQPQYVFNDHWLVTVRGRYDDGLNLIWLEWVNLPWETRTHWGEIERGRTLVEVTDRAPAMQPPHQGFPAESVSFPQAQPVSPAPPSAAAPSTLPPPAYTYETEGLSYYGSLEEERARGHVHSHRRTRARQTVPPYYYGVPLEYHIWYFPGETRSHWSWSPGRVPPRRRRPEEDEDDETSSENDTNSTDDLPPIVLDPSRHYQGPSPRLDEMQGNAERMGYPRRMILQHRERAREIVGH